MSAKLNLVIRRLRMLLQSGGFARNAAMLTMGTLGAQALNFIAYPVLTRLYTPEEFGVVAVIYTLTSLLAVIASGAIENAILIAKSKRSAAHIIGWIILRSSIVLGISLLLTGTAVLFGIGRLVGEEVAGWLPIVPVMAAAIVIFNCFSEWCIREKQFAKLARFRIAQNFLVSGIRIVLGFVKFPLNGLIAGDVSGKLLSVLCAVNSIFSRNFSFFSTISLKRIRLEQHRYSSFSRYMMPDQLLNIIGGTLHVPFFAASFGTAELGYVSMTFSLLYLPVSIFSAAVKDVFRQRVAEQIRAKGNCRTLYLKLLIPVTLVGALGFGLLYWFSPWLFTFLLGANWAPVGEYIRILTPMFFMNFVSMSLGGVLIVAQRLKISLFWQIVNLIMTFIALSIGLFYYQSVDAMLWGLTIAKSVSYLIYMILSFFFAGERLMYKPLGNTRL